MRLGPSIREVSRATTTLQGLVTGLSIDQEINDKEIAALLDWLDFHEELLKIPPFSELKRFLHEILLDHVIEHDERQMLVDWCQDFANIAGRYSSDYTTLNQFLHGVLAGIASDRKITEQEVIDLQDWLNDFSVLSGTWPYSDVCKLVEHVLEDGKVSEEEKALVLEFCSEFAEREAPDGQERLKEAGLENPYWKSKSPVVKTLSYIINSEHEIEVAGRSFCFTGIARFGKRKDLVDLLLQNGGVHLNAITYKLDYLVIGALSQPSWAYSVYGRKIEKALSLSEDFGCPIIVGEDDFLRKCNIPS